MKDPSSLGDESTATNLKCVEISSLNCAKTGLAITVSHQKKIRTNLGQLYTMRMKKIIKRFAINIQYAFPVIFLIIQLFKLKHRSLYRPLIFGKDADDLFAAYHRTYIVGGAQTVALDLGCGEKPRNLFHATTVLGVDRSLPQNAEKILRVELGYEVIPYPDSHFDYITAYDLLEHIPRIQIANGTAPFIFLMNEVYRIMKDGGIFLSSTPAAPFLSAFADPTHVNPITSETFEYFTSEKSGLRLAYGISAAFKIVDRCYAGDHLICVLKK